MQVSQNGISYRIVNGGTKIIDRLPAKMLEIQFDKFLGTWLEERKDLEVGNFKVYGNTPTRIGKIYRTFGIRDKNLGILLSGDKGMGKSVFMRCIAVEAIKKGLPVIVVTRDIPGLADYIGKIDQECVVLFDEFEKNFLKDGEHQGDEQGGQTQFLSLLDGTDSGKKLYVIAINNDRKLSEFFINRPGRFYYHFKFSYLSEDEVREYATDTLKESDTKKETVDKLCLLAKFHDVNYDILSSIITELNNGYTLKETISDLNIDISETQKYYDIETVIDGIMLRGSTWVESDDENTEVNLSVEGCRFANIVVGFDITKAKIDKKEEILTLDENAINSTYLCHNFGKYTNDNQDEIRVTKLILRPHRWGNASGLSYLL